MTEEVWSQVSGWVHEILGFPPETFVKMVNTFLVLMIYLLASRVLKRTLAERVEDPSRRYKLSKSISWAVGTLALLAIFKIWVAGNVAFTTYFGILSAGLAIALKDPITNLAGWLFLITRQPFKVSDRIQIGTHAGDVVDIRLFMFTILEIGNWVDADQSTGRIIHVPNGVVFQSPIANYTQAFAYIWNEIGVTVTFESDWRKAKQILTDVAQKHAGKPIDRAKSQIRNAGQQYEITFQHLTPIVWVDVIDFGVKLTIRYLCAARKRRSSASDIWSDILTQFAREPAIDFAYPTQRFYDNKQEGKEGTGGPPPKKRPKTL